MSSSPVKRKLAAILSADAFEYSRMMAADEEGTAKILAAHRAVIDGIIEFHEGRIVNTAGDSVLAEFASPIESVRCAVEIQEALKTRNDALPEAQRMHFRIGVNLGDVMIKGEDLLGDGVNVAARLQGLAEPGNIYLSSSVYDQIAGKLDLGFVDLGEKSLKNIDRPIRAYRVEREGRSPPRAPARGRLIAVWTAVALALAAAAGATGWYVHRAKEAEQQALAQAQIEKARADAEEAKRQPAAAAREAAKRKPAAEKPRKKELAKAAPASPRAPEAPAPKTHAYSEAEAVSKAPGWESLRSRFAGAWQANFSCEPGATKRPARWSTAFTVESEAFEIKAGRQGEPGSFRLSGTPGFAGRLSLSGSGVERDKSEYPAEFKLKRQGPRFSGSGTLGKRACELELVRVQ